MSRDACAAGAGDRCGRCDGQLDRRMPFHARRGAEHVNRNLVGGSVCGASGADVMAVRSGGFRG